MHRYYWLEFSYGGSSVASSDGKYASTVRVGEKGQIVIPKPARELFGIQRETPCCCSLTSTGE